MGEDQTTRDLEVIEPSPPVSPVSSPSSTISDASRLPLKSCFKPLRSAMKKKRVGSPKVDATHNSPGLPKSPKSLDTSFRARQARRAKRRVAFGRLEINEFPPLMGDNPSCTSGAPLTIAWNRTRHLVFDLEYYETYNPSERRRKREEFRVDAGERSAILFVAGYSMMEIVNCAMDVSQTRSHRWETNKNRKWDGVNEAIEKTTRTIVKAARRSSLLTASTAEVLISPLRASPRKSVGRFKSTDKVTLRHLQSKLQGDNALAA